MPSKSSIAQKLKNEARRLGFNACGISRATFLDKEARRLEQWLSNGRHASMAWMENHFDKRVDPRELVPGAQSVISLIHSYYTPGTGQLGEPQPKDKAAISSYAQGDDYHDVLKQKLFELLDWLRTEAGDITARVFVDSAPVMDKVWAERSGLGWIGKNTNLIHPKLGSYFFVAELIVDISLPEDSPIADHCGSCTRCIDACPTDAFVDATIVDASRCISYWTIEHRSHHIPEEISANMGNWIFGCDICQQVCPWNKFSEPTEETRLQPRNGIKRTVNEWEEIDEQEFSRVFRNSPVKRARFSGFMRNVRAVAANQQSRNPPGEPEA